MNVEVGFAVLLLALSGCFADPGMGTLDTGETEGTGASDTTMDVSTDTTTTGDSTSGSEATSSEATSSESTGDTDTTECSSIRFGENADDDVLAVTHDTWIDEENPTANNGDDDDLRADGVSVDGLTETLFIRFDLSALPEGTVTEAVLYLSTNADEGSRSSSGSQFFVHAVGEPWTEAEATWEQASAGTPWSVLGCAAAPCRGESELVFFEPTEQAHTYALAIDPLLAALWRDDPTTNFGLMVATLAENGGHFHSSESGDVTFRPSLELRVCP